MRINKNYFFLILVLFVVFFAVMAILIPTPQKSKVSLPPPPTQQPPKILAWLSFQPESLNLTEEQEFTSNIFLRTEREAVAADLEIIYDPTVLTFQKMTLGKFWAEGKLIGQKIDQKSGRILAGIVSFEPASGSGNLISLKFKVQKTVEKPAAELMFGEKTQLVSPGGEIIPLEISKETIYTLTK